MGILKFLGENLKELIEFAIVIGGLFTIYELIKKAFKSSIKETKDDIIKTVDAIKASTEKQNADTAIIVAKNSLAVEELSRALTEKIDINERDRLRQEIFRTAAECRNGNYLSGEQFSYLRDQVVAKYHSLGGNSVGDKAWEFICDYYYQQCSQDNK